MDQEFGVSEGTVEEGLGEEGKLGTIVF